MVALDATRFDRSAARPDLGDLMFVLDGAILPHDVEDTGTTVIAWVRLPVTSRGPLYVYYGGPIPSVSVGPAWPETDYVGVWHLADGRDVARGNHGTVTAATVVPGRIGYGLDLAAGSNGHVRVPDAPTTHWTTGVVTASGWMQLRSPQGTYSTLVGREYASTTADDFGCGESGGAVNAEIQTDNGRQLLRSGIIGLQSWHHYALVYDGASILMYFDSLLVIDEPLTGAVMNSSNPILFGADCNTGIQMAESEFVDGIIDEIRIETVVRSASWIAAEYASQTDAWITYGPIER